MVKKLTIKTWTSTGILLAVCLVLAIFPLYRYLPSALALLQKKPPLLNESQSNIYGISALGIVMLIICIAIFIKQLSDPVSKRVNRFLEEHPETNMAQLDQEFFSAEKIGTMWIGNHRTFSHDMRSVVVENAEIVRVYMYEERERRTTNYYVCLELKNGKTERVKNSYYDISKILELYRKHPDIQVADL